LDTNYGKLDTKSDSKNGELDTSGGGVFAKPVFLVIFAPTISTKKNKMGALITNRDLIQSYIVTSARYDFSVYEKRILYRIIEMIQYLIEGKKLNACYSIEEDLFGDRKFTMPVAAFLAGEEDNHYGRAKEALRRLEEKKFEYEDDELWTIIHIIEKVRLKKRDSYVNFEVRKELYEAFMDFSKGFRRFELKTTMMFTSVYAMRFYELISGKTDPVNYDYEALKLLFGLQDRYKRINDFTKDVIDAAKKELDAKSPYTFRYTPYKHGRKIAGWTFVPIYQPQLRDPQLERKELQKQINLSWDLPREVRIYLRDNYLFLDEEIKRNIDVFKAMHARKNLLEWLAGGVKARALRAKNPKGYLINAMKKETN
jgi:hypothetical protein